MANQHPNELHAELLGLHALNFAAQHNSSPRNVMMGSHFSQKLTLLNGTEKRIQTGADIELGKHTYAIRMPVTGKIIQVIDLYPRSIAENSINENPESYVIYEDIQTHEIGMIVLPKFISHHQYFGYPLKPTSNYQKVVAGSVIEADTVLLDSPAIGENGGYKYGIELNVAMMTHPATAEDGILISEDVLDRLKFNIYERRTVEFGKDVYPLNIYGTNDEYKPFPEIGEMIRDDGVLMVLRDMEIDLSPVDMSVYDLREPDYIFDKTIYVRGGEGKVISIKMYHKDEPVTPTPTNMMSSMDKYSHALTRFYTQIIELENKLRMDRRRKFGNDSLPLKPEFHQLVTEAMVYLDTSPIGKKTQSLTLEHRKTPLDDYRIEFVIEYTIRPTIGFKMTGVSGDKGVICKIEKPENMPIDSDGNRADVVVDPGSTVSRMNIGRVYETYISAAARDVTKAVRRKLGIEVCRYNKTLKAIQALHASNPALIDEVYTYILGFFKLISEEQFSFYTQLNIQDRLEYLTSVVCEGVYIYFPTHNDKETTDIVRDIQKYYPPTYGPVTYVGNSGQRVTTKRPIRIAPMYMMVLEKIADDWSAVSSGKLQHFGVLAPITKSEKYLKPWHNSPVRNIGETEARLYSANCGREAMAELMDRNNSPDTHKYIVKKLMSSEHPTNIKEIVDRSVIPIGGSKALQMFKHFVICQGWKPVYRKQP